MSWTDIFLIPFKVSLSKTKNMFQIKNSFEYNEGNIMNNLKNEEDIRKNLLGAIDEDSIEIRKHILSILEEEIADYQVEKLYLAIFGERPKIDFSDPDCVIQATNCLNILKKFKQEDSIAIDTIDKMLIDQLIIHLEYCIEYDDSCYS